MKVLHTSDWHLGRSLLGKKRHAEHEAFLEWLLRVMDEHRVDALLVAGDVFDTGAPGNNTQELYYRFLSRIAATCCRHAVIIAGNHDSPSFLDAPRPLLRALRVHVVGSAAENPADEVVVLRRDDNTPEMIVAAVPYLRDRDIRTAEAGETPDDKVRNLLRGIAGHYDAALAAAEQARSKHGDDIPLVAMGHLFTTGGKTVDGDGVRDLYVGALAGVSPTLFPPTADYVALGHLHLPQPVAQASRIRYSGSPLPMGFNEAGQPKSVCLVDFRGRQTTVEELPVPVFQALETIRGDWDTIATRIALLAQNKTSAWLDIQYDGADLIADLRSKLDEGVADTGLEILRVKNNRTAERVLKQDNPQETLDDLEPGEVFERCLALHQTPDEQRPGLRQSYQEALAAIHDPENSTAKGAQA
ncbi:MAG: exonuclease SbcCD subunit D C-terminal domain-containing protein [Lentisphaeria bacterium]|nr:exonuclease SbcCD subunit D C-terminal domain-containing protein [Lentisphaeria bacterium]